jgi:hypothetical protein
MRQLLILSLLLNYQILFSQVSQSQNLTTPITLHEIELKIEEVYGRSFIENNTTLVQFFNKLLKERITYITQERTSDEKYIKLSSLSILNKNNSNLRPDSQFIANEFNPLKYNMNFYSKITEVYRFDNSDILIFIAPQ